MIHDLAEMLLRRVYHPIVAVICADANDRVLHIELLDAMFIDTESVIVPDAERIYLVFSNADGGTRMTKEEISLLGQMKKQAGNASLSAFLYIEDEGLIEVDR